MTDKQPEAFRPSDLLAQTQSLVLALTAERQARELAEAADKAKSEVLAAVSDEMRAPMSAVISMSERLLSSPLDDRQQSYARTLQRSARSLLTVLNDIFDYSKLEVGRIQLDYAPLDLHALVQSVGNDLRARTREKKLKGSVHLGMSCPRSVKGDEGRLRRILAILIDNAVKFTSRGSVQLHINAGEAGDRLTLRFDVSDTGIGLSDADRDLLFQPCITVQGSEAHQHGGTGLGLSIARRLVELMDGEIGCESALGRGSLFWFTIPTEPTMLAASKEEPKLPAGTLSGRVLLVEDNAVNRMLIGAYLEEFGLAHDMVQSGADALMRLSEKSYDLVLMDMMMPELDGVETTRRIRKMQGPAAEVAIVALTTQVTNADRETYLTAGIDGYVSKPIRGRELFAALAPHLTRDEDEARLVAVH